MKTRYIPVRNRKKFFPQILFIAGMGAIFVAVVVLYFAAFAVGTEKFVVDRTFYFLVLPSEEQTVSAWAQDAYVSGGAGYAFRHRGRQYIALSSYKTENEAKNVRDTLETRGKETEILPLKVDTLYFSTKSQRESKAAVEGCVHTLLQCVDLLYNTANGVDAARYTQEEAREVIRELRAVFNGLREKSVPQTENLLSTAVRKCREIASGIVYAKDIRYLQLFLSEGIYSLQSVFGN